MNVDPAYFLAVFAVAAPAFLIVQNRRRRVRVYCCSGSVDARHDLRMRAAFDETSGEPEDASHP